MRVLIACECSGVSRVAFRLLGHDAYSVDLKPDETGETKYHYIKDARSILHWDWDLLIAHPPCTFLCFSGERWIHDQVRYPNRKQDREEAKGFFMSFMNAPIKKICVENPRGTMTKTYRPADQIIQPWMFGTPETKETHFWLKNLPKLQPTSIVELPQDKASRNRIHYLGGKNRSEERSRSYLGIAQAMAVQWGGKLTNQNPNIQFA